MTLHTLGHDRLPHFAEAPARPGVLSGVAPALVRVLRRGAALFGPRPVTLGDGGGASPPGPVSPFLQGLVGPQDYWRGGSQG